MKPLAAALFVVASTLGLGSARAQDVAVSQVGTSGDFRFYGTNNGRAAYSFATTSCNVGDQLIRWDNQDGEFHPVIAQNFFRMHQGRFEQLGYSWLKHGFCAVNENSCGSCQGTSCGTLGLGCADTYGSGLNDGGSGGGKFQVNPATGYAPHPVQGPSQGHSTVRGRLQVRVDEVDPALNPDARYFAEAQYLTVDDHMAGNARNNASWRPIQFSSTLGVSATSSTVMFEPAIYAWAAFDSDVTIRELVSPDEGGPGVHGWYFLGSKARRLEDGRWRYEYALQNLNSDRGARSFSIRAGCGAAVSDVFFRDVNGHSGEPWSSVDWSFTHGSDNLTWSTDRFSADPLANALRWGTLYNFGFTSDRAPSTTVAALALFEPGGPDSLQTQVEGPCGEPLCGTYNFCQSAPNSQTGGARITSSGSTSLAANDLVLTVNSAGGSSAGLFFYGTQPIEVPFGDGFRCAGGFAKRLAPVLQTSVLGDASLALDVTRAPLDRGPARARAGATLHFQFWFRDPLGPGGSGFNTSDGLAVTFCP